MRLRPLVLAVVVLSACGGDDRLSEEEYREQGNAICSKYERQIDAVPEPRGDTAQEIVDYVDKVEPLAEKQVDEVRELKPPEDDQATHDEMIREAERTLDAIRDLRRAADANDPAAAREAIEQGESAGDNADALAKQLGLDACADDDE